MILGVGPIRETSIVRLALALSSDLYQIETKFILSKISLMSTVYD